MRLSRHVALALLPLALTGCNIEFTGIGGSGPSNLTYSVIAGSPAMVMLTWDLPVGRHTTTFAVYGRPSTSGGWYLLGVTTSPSFLDSGEPQLQYYVAARDEDDMEFGRTNVVTIDFGDRLPAPQGLTTTPATGAMQLRWNANAASWGGSQFANYRVYSARFDQSRGGCPRDGWVLEGTTISEQFTISGLTSGTMRCFAVSAVNKAGMESSWSEVIVDTVR